MSKEFNDIQNTTLNEFIQLIKLEQNLLISKLQNSISKPYNSIYTNFVSKMNKVIKNNNIIFTTYLDITPQIITTIFCPISKEYIPLSNVTFNKSESIVTFSLPNITPYNQEKITFVIKGQVNLGNNFYNTYDCRL